MTFTLTREQLYDLVWSEPMQRLSQQIGISDVAIAKHCRKLGIPVPHRGYWNKLQAGKKVTKTELPKRDLVTLNRVTMSGELSRELRARLKGEPGKPGDDNEDINGLADRLRKRLGEVTVPRNFHSRVHPLIAPLLAKDEKLRQESTPYRFSWNTPRFESPFERRRLLFINGLFLGFEKVGGKPWLRGRDARELSIYMGDSSVSFQVEKSGSGRSKRRGERADEEQEKLYLTLTYHDILPGIVTRWEDQEGRPLEKQLADIIVGMAVAGQHYYRHWIEQQAAWERRRRAEAEAEERRRKAEAEKREKERLAAIEKAKVDKLVSDANAWREAGNIRSYVAAVLQASNAKNHGAVAAWSEWALVEADKLDPIKSGNALAGIEGECSRADAVSAKPDASETEVQFVDEAPTVGGEG